LPECPVDNVDPDVGPDGKCNARYLLLLVASTAVSQAWQHGGEGDGRRERWAEHRATRRRQFVDAALRVLARQGPGLTMEEVAAEAGVTKPVLYRYFHDKAALVQALDERGTELLFAQLLPAIRSDGPGLARVRDAVGAYFSVIDAHPNLYWLVARQSAGEDPGAGAGPVDEHKEFIAATLAAVIGDYLRGFELEVEAAEPWAHGLTGLVQSTGEWWLRRRTISRDVVVDYVTQLIWAGLSGVLRQAGVVVDPEQPFSAGRPKPA
jgi:AcrR family transcriptional regulator